MNPNVVVVLIGGAPMALPWIGSVKAVLAAYLGGEGNGNGRRSVAIGPRVPPAASWRRRGPCVRKMRLAIAIFRAGGRRWNTARSIYVGYRYYEKGGDAGAVSLRPRPFLRSL